MKLSLNIIESDTAITQSILIQIQEHMTKTIKKIEPLLIKNIQTIVKNSIVSEPEYQSLLSGQLKYEFGIPNSSVVDSIIDQWINNINVRSMPIKISINGLVGGFAIDMIKDDYSDVLSSPEAQFTDTNSGFKIPWLQWLLIDGGKILVKNYIVKMGPNPRSRTGMAIMVESSKQNWMVPPQFAGTISNNWVYRAISRIENEIESTMKQVLENNI